MDHFAERRLIPTTGLANLNVARQARIGCATAPDRPFEFGPRPEACSAVSWNILRIRVVLRPVKNPVSIGFAVVPVATSSLFMPTATTRVVGTPAVISTLTELASPEMLRS